MRKICLKSFLQAPQLRGLSRFLCLSAVGVSLLAGSAPTASAATIIREALFLYNNATGAALQAGDIVVSNRLVQLGFRVNTIDGLTFNAFTTAQATNAANTNDIVVISSSIDSGQVGNKLRDVPTPVLDYEGSLFDDFRFSNAAGAVQGAQTNLTVVNPFTPLAAGFPAGTVRVANPPGGNFTFFTLNDLNDDTAIVVARGVDPGSNSRQAYVAYEKNALLRDGSNKATGRRVGFFFEQGNNSFVPQFLTNITFTTNMSVITTNVAITTNAGLSFFDAAVGWLTSPPDFTSPVAIPQGPANLVGTELLTVSFNAIVTGALAGTGSYGYQWQRTNNVDGWTNVPNATHRTFVTDPLKLTDHLAQFRLIVTNNFSSATSGVATLTVNADVAKPTIASSASFPGGTNNITIVFSEGVTQGPTETLANYIVIDISNNGANVPVTGAAVFANNRTVVLTVAALVPGHTYAVLVSGVQDLALVANTILQFSNTQFVAPALPNIVVEFYNNVGGGTAWTDLVRMSKFLDHTPDSVSVSNTYFGINTNLSDPGLGANYGARLYSYFVPPTNGTYVFYIRGDDGVRLAMTTNSTGSTDPSKAVILCSTQAFVNVNYRADSSKSGPVTLTGGQSYYIEGLVKEGGGGDGFGMTFRAASDAAVPPDGEVALASSFRLPADLLGSSPFGPVTVGTGPTNLTVGEGQPASFSVANINGVLPRTFQWQRSDGSGGFTNIPGATSTSFRLAATKTTDGGAQFRLVASNPFSTATTAAATLTVTPDTTAPVLASASTFDGIFIGLKFNEQTRLDPTAANDRTQYIIDGGPTVTNPLGIASATLRSDGVTVVLQLSNAVTTNMFNVTVLTARDTSAAANAAASLVVVGKNASANGVSSVLFGGTPQPGRAVTFGDGTYEITAGGNDIWGSQDQGRYVYVSKAGDFDARVRVDGLSIPANGESPSIAKGGLMVRVDQSSNSPTLHNLVNPAPAGRDQGEAGARLTASGGTDDWIPAPADLGNRPATTNGAPNFNVRYTPVGVPNAWVRIVRVGNLFTAYRSFDGVIWGAFSSVNVPTAPATVLVGLTACAHNPAAANTNNGPVTVASFSSFNVGIVQHPPVAGNDTVGTLVNTPVTVSVSKLLSNDSDVDGDTLSLSAVSAKSTAGGTVVLAGGNVTFTPTNNFVGTDTFTYTLNDSAGLSASVTVTVTVRSIAVTDNLVGITLLPGGGIAVVQFYGIVGQPYDIQASTDLKTWTKIGSATPDSKGLITFLDNAAGQFAQRFYRTAVPPAP